MIFFRGLSYLKKSFRSHNEQFMSVVIMAQYYPWNFRQSGRGQAAPWAERNYCTRQQHEEPEKNAKKKSKFPKLRHEVHIKIYEQLTPLILVSFTGILKDSIIFF